MLHHSEVGVMGKDQCKKLRTNGQRGRNKTWAVWGPGNQEKRLLREEGVIVQQKEEVTKGRREG